MPTPPHAGRFKNRLNYLMAASCKMTRLPVASGPVFGSRFSGRRHSVRCAGRSLAGRLWLALAGGACFGCRYLWGVGVGCGFRFSGFSGLPTTTLPKFKNEKRIRHCLLGSMPRAAALPYCLLLLLAVVCVLPPPLFLPGRREPKKLKVKEALSLFFWVLRALLLAVRWCVGRRVACRRHFHFHAAFSPSAWLLLAAALKHTTPQRTPLSIKKCPGFIHRHASPHYDGLRVLMRYWCL